MIQESDDQFNMYEGNAYVLDENRKIFKSIKRVNERISDFLDVCSFINQYSITFMQGISTYKLGHEYMRSATCGYIGDAYFCYSTEKNGWNDSICIDVAFDHDDLRGVESWRFIKSLYSCVGKDDDKMNGEVLYPTAMTIRKGPHSPFYFEKFYSLYIKDESDSKHKFTAFDTFCRRLCGDNGKPFNAYLR